MAHLGLTSSLWQNARVLVTGHTGFKGSWLCLLLESMGAKVGGLALPPESETGAFSAMKPWARLDEQFVDIRDGQAVRRAVDAFCPDLVMHLAAQALVRRSYLEPVATFDVNVMGTAHVLESLSSRTGVVPAVVVTSDKVYRPGAGEPHREDDPLGGRDPYSASKACAEHVVESFRASHPDARVATARAGNVIGGGDEGEDRLVPDILRALDRGETVILRNPSSVRPWQHVLDPLRGYLMLAEQLLGADPAPLCLNFGPSDAQKTVADVADMVVAATGQRGGWEVSTVGHPPETPILRLDSEAARSVLGWRPVVDLPTALRWTVEWHRAPVAYKRSAALQQIQDFEAMTG